MTLAITGLYAGIMMIFALALSFRAGGFRGSKGISVLFGNPENMELVQRVRVHQNFLEYVPLALIDGHYRNQWRQYDLPACIRHCSYYFSHRSFDRAEARQHGSPGPRYRCRWHRADITCRSGLCVVDGS